MTARLGAADPRLSDPEWVRRAYDQHGDMWIALETGAARETIRRRRDLFGISSKRPGRRRDMPIAETAVLPIALDATEQAFCDRYQQAKNHRTPAAVDTTFRLALKAAHDARQAGDANAEDQAWIDISVAAALIHDHRQQLRAA